MMGLLRNGIEFDDIVMPVVPDNCSRAMAACTPALCVSCAGMCFRSLNDRIRVAGDDEDIPGAWTVGGCLMVLTLGRPGVRLMNIGLDEH
jgi:hypothetical protein